MPLPELILSPLVPFATFATPDDVGDVPVWNGESYDLLNYLYDVRSYGAVGDGATDDTTAIQAAFDAVAAEGGIVYFAPGTYICTAQITSSGNAVSVNGAGMNISRIKWLSASPSSGFLFTQNDDDYTVFFSNLSLITEKVGSGTAIKVDETGQVSGGIVQDRVRPRFVLRDVSMHGATNELTDGWSIGVDLVNVMGPVIDGLHFVGKRNSATPTVYASTAAIQLTTAATGQATEVDIINSWAFGASYGVLATEYEGVRISNCNFVIVGYGLYYTAAVSNPQINVVDSHINYTVGGIKLIEATQSVVSGNLIYQNETAGVAGIGIELATSDNCMIDGNTFYNLSASNMDAITLSGISNRNLIQPNVFHSCTNAIIIGASSANTRVSDGQIYTLVTGTEFTDSGTSNIAIGKSRSYTPTWTAQTLSPALGNGTLTGKYIQNGNHVHVEITLTAGNTTTFGTGTWFFTLPVTPTASAFSPAGCASSLDSSLSQYRGALGMVVNNSGAKAAAYDNSGATGALVAYESSYPMTWATSDVLIIALNYESA